MQFVVWVSCRFVGFIVQGFFLLWLLRDLCHSPEGGPGHGEEVGERCFTWNVGIKFGGLKIEVWDVQ